LALLDTAEINHNNGTIKIKINEYMRPFLVQLKDHFTKYELFYTLAMRNKYSLRMYELLKSYENLQKRVFDFHELSKLLFAESYEFYDFKRRVLEPAIKEINEYSDITVIHEYIKKERGFYDIEFIIKPKPTAEKIEAIINVERKIDKGQMSMFTPDVNDSEETP
jgi:plasmid replication initiation protein